MTHRFVKFVASLAQTDVRTGRVVASAVSTTHVIDDVTFVDVITTTVADLLISILAFTTTTKKYNLILYFYHVSKF